MEQIDRHRRHHRRTHQRLGGIKVSMSELNDLITKLCPNGVPYKKLEEVAEIKRGRRVVKKELSQDNNSGYPVYQNSLKPLGYHTCSNEKAGTPFVIAAGSAGEIGYSDVDYWGADDCYSIECDDNTVNGRYIYHVLLLKQGRIKSQVRRASIPRLSSTAIKHLEIPVPPIEIQHEVVRILDAFTELEAELEAELAGKKKQYEYYRNQMLSQKRLEAMDGKPVEMRKFGEAAHIGKGTYITKKETVPGKIPVILGGMTPAYWHNEANHEGEAIVISRSGANAGFVSYWNEPIFVSDGFIVETDDALICRYLYYALKSVQNTINTLKRGGGVPHVNGKMLADIKIPVPSLATQERIVDILDRFDTLTTSLTKGIPAEIAMRREQYEYCRSRILDFPRLPDNSDSDGE